MKRTLYHKTSTGKIQTWTIWTEGDTIFTEYGQLNGKMQTATKKATPKNEGRSNETTAEEQAVLEAESMHTFKKERKYFESIDEAENVPLLLPMLAHSWDKHHKKFSNVSFFVQPKLDGVRCIAVCEDGEIRLLSRSGKEYDVPHLKKELLEIMEDGDILDGEIYEHGVGFQAISGAVKKVQDSTHTLQYWIYDMCDDQLPFSKRMDRVAEIMGRIDSDSSSLIAVPSHKVLNYLEVITFHEYFVQDGFEGLIARHPDLPYKFGYRSNLLLKYKDFDDAEFKIIGYTNGVGKFENTVIWVCEMDDGSGKTFNVVPKGSQKVREAFLKDAEAYIGQMLTVTYFGRSVDRIPRFPVGKGIRDSRDMS